MARWSFLLVRRCCRRPFAAAAALADGSNSRGLFMGGRWRVRSGSDSSTKRRTIISRVRVVSECGGPTRKRTGGSTTPRPRPGRRDRAGSDPARRRTPRMGGTAGR